MENVPASKDSMEWNVTRVHKDTMDSQTVKVWNQNLITTCIFVTMIVDCVISTRYNIGYFMHNAQWTL